MLTLGKMKIEFVNFGKNQKSKLPVLEKLKIENRAFRKNEKNGNGFL